MTNLITEKQKKVIKWDYYIRLSALSILMFSLLGLFLLAYIIPYSISISKKDLIVAEQFKSVISVENKENVGESVAEVVKRTLDEMKAVETYGLAGFVPADIFNRIIANKNSYIQITKLSFTIINQKQGQFIVRGLAKKREGLVAFVEDLKSKANFSNVESPISDLAREADINFTINININL